MGPSRLDTLISADTPEGLRFDLHPAGLYARTKAYMIDTLIQAVGLVGIILIGTMATAGGMGTWLSLLLFFVLQWFYFTLFEALNRGQTPGKALANIQVIQSDGTPLTFGSALLRNLIRAIDGSWQLFPLGLPFLLFTRRFQRLGDFAAGSLVIYTPAGLRLAGRAAVQPRAGVPLAPPFNLDHDTSRAILSFSQRAATFSRERGEDLAKTLLGKLGLPVPNNPLEAVHGLAAWISGQRTKP